MSSGRGRVSGGGQDGDTTRRSRSQDIEEAARYVAYYASPQMHRTAVERLYYTGVQNHNEALEKAERAMYPELTDKSNATTTTQKRTPNQVDAYLKERVNQELFRRKKKLAELERDLYPDPFATPSRTTLSGLEVPTKFRSKQEHEKHVRHMYTDQLRRKYHSRRELEAKYGPYCCTTDEFHRLNEDKDLLANPYPLSGGGGGAAGIGYGDDRSTYTGSINTNSMNPNRRTSARPVLKLGSDAENQRITNGRTLTEREINRERETQWRPARRTASCEGDNAHRFLCGIDNQPTRRQSAGVLAGSGGRSVSPSSRTPRQRAERLALLSKPMRVTKPVEFPENPPPRFVTSMRARSMPRNL